MHTEYSPNFYTQHYTSDLHRTAVQQHVAQQVMTTTDDNAPLINTLIALVVRMGRRSMAAKSAPRSIARLLTAEIVPVKS
jgi:hypothetical protein